MMMQSLIRSRFLHRCTHGASYRACIESKPSSVPHEALSTPYRTFKHVSLIGGTRFTVIPEGQMSNVIFANSFLINPHLQALRCLSGVAVAATPQPVTADARQACPSPATLTDHYASTLRHYAHCYWELSKARLRWAAAVGEVSMGGWVLASALYFWQIPHFMAIAYLCRQDYAAGGFKMLSMQDDSGQRTALAALRNCIYLFPVGYLAYRCGLTTEWFGVETALLSAVMGVMAASFYRNPSNEGAKKLFRASLLYLPIFLTAMLVHRLPNKDTNEVFNESYVTDVLDADHALEESMEKKPSQRKEFPQPPVASFSVAPFPFLPVPDFRSS